MVKKYPSLGAVLKKIRKRKGLSAYKLCKLADVDTSYYSKIENNKLLPSPEIMKRITLQLNSDGPYLMGQYIQKKYPDLMEIFITWPIRQPSKEENLKRIIKTGIQDLLFEKVSKKSWENLSMKILKEIDPSLNRFDQIGNRKKKLTRILTELQKYIESLIKH